jgi:hypothetical protein
MDGITPEYGDWYEAVNLGVKSIQHRLVSLGYDDGLKFADEELMDGVFRRRTRRMVRRYQSDNGIAHTGTVGPITASRLFGSYISEVGTAFKFDPKYIYGIMMAESAADPGAQGWFTPGDRGLYQFNTLVHPDIDIYKAHDYEFATEAVFARFNNAWKKYKGKGADLRLNCSIAQHNAPVWANEWFDTGTPPNSAIESYVGRVLYAAQGSPLFT